MDYGVTAKELLKAVGGEKNIVTVSHCMTRLRFNLKESKGLDLEAIEKIPGVMGAIEKGGQLQVIIGNNVAKCYAEIQKIATIQEGGTAKGKKNPLVVALDFIASCMTPLIPAVLAGSMVKVLLVLLGPGILGLLSAESSTYVILDTLGDASFYFLPVLLAYSAARKLETSIPLAMMLAGFLIHPNLVALLGSGEAVHFLGIPVYPGSYASSIIPVMLTVILMKYVDKLSDRITPTWSKSFLKPLLTLLITAPISLLLLAPLGQLLGQGLFFIMNGIYNLFPPLAMCLFAAFMPFIVMGGMHYAFLPTAMTGMVTLGYDIMLLPAMFCSNLAQAAATFAVAVKSKRGGIRQVAGPSAISAFLAGVTEPAMYGVTLKYKTPMAAACIGGGVGGILMGIFRVKVYAFAVPSLLAIPGLVPTNNSATMSNLAWGIVAVAASVVVTFLATLFLYKDPADADGPAKKATVQSGPINLPNPVKGEVVPLEAVNDPTFSTGVMGKGYGIVPSEGVVVAPFNGVVDNLLDSGHAVGLVSNDGVELLIHVGLETVKLEGKHFKPLVKKGDAVKAGQKLIEFDIEGIQKDGYDITTPVVVTNSEAFGDVTFAAGSGALDALQAQMTLLPQNA